jgi:hypothetical protein
MFDVSLLYYQHNYKDVKRLADRYHYRFDHNINIKTNVYAYTTKEI